MNDGYILLHRSMLDWEWYKDLKTKMLFLYCLLRANWKPAEYRGHHIDRGQFVSTLEHLSADTGLSVGEVRTALKHLTSTGELTSGMKGKYRVITVNNYDHYQNINSFSTDRRQADSSSLAAIEKEEKEKECLSVSSTDVSDTDRQPRAGADLLPDTAPDEEPVKGIPSVTRTGERAKDIRRVIDAWNSLASSGIQTVSTLRPGTKRYRALNARLSEHGTDKVLAAIDRIRESDFLRGVNKQNWVITFDWFVRPNNFIKVLDGNYAKRSAVIADLDISWLEK